MWRGRAFKVCEPDHGRLTICAAHFFRWLQAAAECWTFRLAEDEAAIVFAELNAADTRRLPIGHAGNRAGDGRGGATCSAIVTAIHSVFSNCPKNVRLARASRSCRTWLASHERLRGIAKPLILLYFFDEADGGARRDDDFGPDCRRQYCIPEWLAPSARVPAASHFWTA